MRTYEFLLPLANEELLREALDTLFYEDTIVARLREILPAELEAKFPKREGESHADQITRLVGWVSSRFGGYSVYHVQGRFRAADLKCRVDACDLETKGERYLVDETTAVARFIFPCEDEADAERVHDFFTQLFVEAVLEAVSGEDQIWMVEGGLRNRVHIWSADEE